MITEQTGHGGTEQANEPSTTASASQSAPRRTKRPLPDWKMPLASPGPETVTGKALGLAMWGPGLAWLTSMLTTMIVAQRFVASDRLQFLNNLYTRGQVAMTGSRWRAVVHPSIQAERQYVFCQNHVNLLDHCSIYAATPHFKQGIELAEHFRVPFYGWFMKQRGTIAVHKDVPRKESMRLLTESIRSEVDRGHSLLLFPEGTRTLNGRVGRFRTGVLRIAHELELPLVPVAVTGMFEVMRKGQPYLNPGHQVTVYMDEPVETRGVPRSSIQELADEVRRRVARRVNHYYDAQGS